MAAESGNNLAVLIDADNVSAKVIGGLMAEVANYGTASVRRIYGDWTSPYMKSWRECLLKHSITPFQQFAYTTGKNATDGAMIIDAMDLLYTGRFSGFCLVSSDSDFTRLAARVREQGVTVYGFGERKTPAPFIAACSKFIFFDVLPAPTDAPEQTEQFSSTQPQPALASFPVLAPAGQVNLPIRPPVTSRESRGPPSTPQPSRAASAPRPLDNAAIGALRRAILSSNTYEDDLVNLAELGLVLNRLSPDLNARNYGYNRLSEFVTASGIVQLEMRSRPPHPPIALVRLKETNQHP